MNGTSEFTDKWIKSTMYTLVGFAGYRLVTQKIVPEVDESYKSAIHTQVQFITMFAISRLLSGEPFDDSFINSSLYTLIGFASYDLVVSKF